MTPPSKFQNMRLNRRHNTRRVFIDQLREEARALGYDDTEMVIEALMELDNRRCEVQPNPQPKRWWWPTKFFQRG